jgi:hypothetical protein
MRQPGFHHSEETKQKIRFAHTGKKKPWVIMQNKIRLTGGHHSKETREKIGIGNLNKVISEESREKMSIAKKGKHLSPKTEFKKGDPRLLEWIRLGRNVTRGENHWNWKGGITPERERWRASPKMNRFRKEVFIRDNYTCQICGKRGGVDLHAHHIFSFKDHPQYMYDPGNGMTLCKKCHLVYFHHLSFGGNQKNGRLIQKELFEIPKYCATQ